MTCCSLEDWTTAVAAYYIATGLLRVFGKVDIIGRQEESSKNILVLEILMAFLFIIAGILLYTGVSKKSKPLVTGWLIIVIIQGLLQIIVLGFLIYLLALLNQITIEFANADDTKKCLGKRVGLMLLDLLIQVAGIVIVVKYRKQVLGRSVCILAGEIEGAEVDTDLKTKMTQIN